MTTDNDEADGEGYGDERSRVYRAAGGSKRCPMLLFIPHPGKAEFDRLIPYTHVQYVEARKDGSRIHIELHDLTVVLTGRNLRSVALGIGAHACSRVEAFDSDHRDLPTSADDPVITAIEYKKLKAAIPALDE
jgi:hypothetical protein